MNVSDVIKYIKFTNLKQCDRTVVVGTDSKKIKWQPIPAPDSARDKYD